ncbi:MAG: DUF3320 domain-containing protein [Magnetococcales bacterium]|nr:DUF3320 domain-containing protein [Magnetococcales bacterium]
MPSPPHMPTKPNPNPASKATPTTRSGTLSFPVDGTIVKGELGIFREATYDDIGLHFNPDRFFDADYEPMLAMLIERCILVEGPIRDDVLARRIGRLHDFHKASPRTREHIASIALCANDKRDTDPIIN